MRIPSCRPGHFSGRTGLRPGLEKARHRKPRPEPGLTVGPQKLGPSPTKPDWPGPTEAEILFFLSPRPARPNHRARNIGTSPARWHSRAGPGRAFSGWVGPVRPGRAAHGQQYPHGMQIIQNSI